MNEQIGVAYFPVWGGAGRHAKQSQASATVVPRDFLFGRLTALMAIDPQNPGRLAPLPRLERRQYV
jgi:hypothetical protein